MPKHAEISETAEPKHSNGVQQLTFPVEPRLWLCVLVDRTKCQVDSVDFLSNQNDAVHRGVAYLTSTQDQGNKKVVYINDSLTVNYSHEMILGLNGFPETHIAIMPDDYFSINMIVTAIASQILTRFTRETVKTFPLEIDNEKGE